MARSDHTALNTSARAVGIMAPSLGANGFLSAQRAFRHPTRCRALLDGTWRGRVALRPGRGDRGRTHMADNAGGTGRQRGREGLPSYGVPGVRLTATLGIGPEGL